MDKDYWEKFYSHKGSVTQEPSLFARYVYENYMANDKSLIELGCGNGRDSIYFAENLNYVLAVDQCNEEITKLTQINTNRKLSFVAGDFTNLDDNKNFDYVYSRFTLHSISKIQENRLIKWIYRVLKPKGKVFIETRGKKNELYNLGSPVQGEKDAFIYNDHFRRFIGLDELTDGLSNHGFNIELAIEEKDFAPYMGENQTFIRLIATKV